MKQIELNPFSGSEEFLDKKPADMSLDELKMLLHIKKLNIKLDVERLKTNVNYYKLIFNTLKELGLVEKLEMWLQKTSNPPENKNPSEEQEQKSS